MLKNVAVVAALVLFSLFSYASENPVNSNTCTNLMLLPSAEFLKVKLSKDGLSALGLEDSAIHKLLAEREKIKKAYSALNKRVLAAKNFSFGIIAAQIAGYHTYIYGGPGAAKSLLPRTLNHDMWYKNMSEQTQSMAIFGGQTLKGAEEGREDINLSQSLVAALFANIDEVDKAQPQVLADFLPILNTGERKISVAGREVIARTRTVHFTSNLNIYSMVERFIANGMEGSGLAFLNRTQIKMRMPNWLQDHLMDQMLEDKQQEDHLKALSLISDQAKSALEKLKAPSDIDWPFLDWVSDVSFRQNKESLVLYRELAQAYAQETKRKLKLSDQMRHEDGSRYSPTAEMTSRLVNEVPKFVRATALLDLLLSDLKDEQIAQILEKRVELSPLSIWRSHWMFTSVGAGITLYNAKTKSVEFDLTPNAKGELLATPSEYLVSIARDSLEVQETQNILEERAQWQNHFEAILKRFLESNKAVALLLPDTEFEDNFEKVDFEHIIFRHRKL